MLSAFPCERKSPAPRREGQHLLPVPKASKAASALSEMALRACPVPAPCPAALLWREELGRAVSRPLAHRTPARGLLLLHSHCPVLRLSAAFYTSKYGYKMCLRVYLNGDGTGRGTHLSLFFVVMKGPNDALLRWPFNQKVGLGLSLLRPAECLGFCSHLWERKERGRTLVCRCPGSSPSC